MEISNIILGKNVNINPSSSINNVRIGDNVRIAGHCFVFGSPNHILEIGHDTYIGMFSIINGFAEQVKVGSHVSIAQNVNIMADSGPNASELMQEIYPIKKAPVIIEDHAWIGAGVIISPGVTIGKCSVIAANSFVCDDVRPFSVYGGSPAKFIKTIPQTDKK